MEPTVHILATVRKAELLDAATLVFKTLRTGFPDGRVFVWGNHLEPVADMAIRRLAQKVGAAYENTIPTAHDLWIKGLVQRGLSPFWICDTDVVFWRKMSAPRQGTTFSGRFEPEFQEEWTGARHMARLHTAVMWIDPVAVRMAMRQFMAKIPPFLAHTAEFPFIRQHFVPLTTVANKEDHGQRKTTILFYDTTAGLWQAVGGTPFDEEQDSAFDHLHCATYVDLVGPHLAVNRLAERHKEIYADPSLARGIRKIQAQYYEAQRPNGPPLTQLVEE